MDERTYDVAAKEPIRVLFISQDCHVQHYTEQMEYAYWYEGAFAFYGGSRVHVGIAYEESDDETNDLSCAIGSSQDSGISYYPLKIDLRHGATESEWEAARPLLLQAIDSFDPDIVQCFGSEWAHAAIAEDVNIPVIVHMMGFLNIYYPVSEASKRSYEAPTWLPTIRKLLFWRRKYGGTSKKASNRIAFERRVMRANRFFMGRTEWDRNIVKYYSPGSHYFEVPEMVRLPFIQGAGSWRYHFDGKLRLFTTASADDRKGIEILLRAAKLLKDLVGIDFEWRIAGHREHFDRFEKGYGIRHGNVNVRLLGMLEAEDIVNELKRADLFVHPSIIDNSPRAICEAQLIGCPSISSNVGGVSQLVEHGVTGFLYPYNEPHALAFLIANLADQHEVLTSVSETASGVARKRHDPKSVVDRMLDVYREVIDIYENEC